MHANVTAGKIREGQISNFISIYQSSVKPVVMDIPGLANLYVLTNKDNSSGLIAAIYESKEDLEHRYEEKYGYREQHFRF